MAQVSLYTSKLHISTWITNEFLYFKLSKNKTFYFSPILFLSIFYSSWPTCLNRNLGVSFYFLFSFTSPLSNQTFNLVSSASEIYSIEIPVSILALQQSTFHTQLKTSIKLSPIKYSSQFNGFLLYWNEVLSSWPPFGACCFLCLEWLPLPPWPHTLPISHSWFLLVLWVSD